MTPYLAPSLATLRAEINQRWPSRDKTSDGWIGDAAHQTGASDHNPNARGSVDAIDVDEDGIDPYAVIAAFQRHPSAHYWIYERQIADRDDGWRRRPYSGPNPHDKHAHFSIRQSATAEQDTRPWGLLEDDMPITDDDAAKIARAVVNQKLGRSETTVGLVLQGLPAALAEAGEDQDPAAIAAAIVGALPVDLARQVADELAARLARPQ